jgi:uncharacterized membrane protein (DUF106 family)
MRIPVIIIAIIVGLIAAYVGYNYMNQPQPMSERIDNTATQLGNGNLGEAVDEAGNATKGEKLQDDLKDATQPPAAQ